MFSSNGALAFGISFFIFGALGVADHLVRGIPMPEYSSGDLMRAGIYVLAIGFSSKLVIWLYNRYLARKV